MAVAVVRSVVVPGTHRSGSYTDRALAERLPLLPRAGDLVLWDSRLWHGTGANTRGETRWTLIATVTMWWIKQKMDMTRAVPPALYARLDEEQRALLGFCSLPPRDERERVNAKQGYEALPPALPDAGRA